ncbi:hypothetical protein C8A01DRAFT_45546 [Parachaetomium inaequale]|uniref:Uncharacterized protein n=1 Tax=Parachaetomium inaequale TaxID=2588326 RepID=A0AAN6ST93_9PEZI|nr:hypothetical protein C8A01DRAFT_45546 [Parachaetomium inaequale]
MSRATPRKSRHRHHASNSGPRQVPASDYESDAAQYLENRETMAPPNPQPARDNTALSLRVLRRYQPSIRSILAIAANAVAYNFLEATQGWEKHGAEGTMFICEQEPIVAPTGQVLPRVCVFVFNRRSMDNLAIDLLRVTDCEVVGELIVFRLEDDAAAGSDNQGEQGTAAKKILGLWIHADETNTREVHASLILGAWQQGRQAFDAYIQAATTGALGNGALAAEPQTSSDSSPPSIEMAPNGNGIRDDMPSTTDGDGAIAAAVQNQLSLVSSFERWLVQKSEVDGDRNDIITRIRSRLDSYKRWLLAAEQTASDPSEDVEPWAMDARAQSGNDDESVIVVTGPGSGEPIRIPTKDKQEFGYLMSNSYLGYIIKICHAFAKAQDTMRSLLRTADELEDETSHLSQPPETTVKTYIRRLQEYNDMKDIGQQLIGLVAENRGVPVRTLYEQGEFGVSFPQ